MTKLEQTQKTIARALQIERSAIVFLSLGKDSLVTLDLIYPFYKDADQRLVCVYMYFVKDLEHINKWINWCKARYPKIEFVQIPHWNLSYILRGGMYSVPQPNIKLIKLADVVESMRYKYNIVTTYLGMKKADGMNRRLMLGTYQQNDYTNNGYVYPVAEWTQKEILAYMKMHRIPEPVRYSLKAFSGVGFNKECFLWLRQNYPQDLQKIYKTFPLSERILYEHDYQQAKTEE